MPSTRAGLRVLVDGGNAVDAAVATALCQGVMNPMASGLGGGGFMTIRTEQGETVVIDAREVAPAAASESMFKGFFILFFPRFSSTAMSADGRRCFPQANFIKYGLKQHGVLSERAGRKGRGVAQQAPGLALAGNKNASVEGGLAVAVPLELKGMWLAHRRYGRRSWASLVTPAAMLAREGFPAHPYLINALNESSTRAQCAAPLQNCPSCMPANACMVKLCFSVLA
jgi:gamma-glutamyltranspeptidase